MRARILPFLLVVPALQAACLGKALTVAELTEALEESALSSQAEALTAGTQELTTSFTIGQAVQDAAEEIRGFVASQLPCADVVRDGATVTVTYGAKPGNCTWKGQTYTGVQRVTVTRNADADVVVEHAWEGVQNQRVMVEGTATVTWSRESMSRHVVHDLAWTRLADNRRGRGTGDRVQTVLDGGLAEGFEVNGTRRWEGGAGTWDLGIEGVEMRWIDPVPQAGRYTLDTPYDVTVVFTFQRVDDDTIAVTATDGWRTRTLNVTRAGTISSGDADAAD